MFNLLKSIIFLAFSALFYGWRRSRTANVVIGSNYGGGADYNAVALADYLLRQDVSVEYIGDVTNLCVKSSGLKRKIKQVRRGSWKSYQSFFRCRACFYTHSLSDVLPHAHRFGFMRRIFRFPRLIFLQHGVIGLKRRLANGKSMGQYIRSLEPTFDHIVVCSAAEFDIVTSLGVPDDKVAITGLPRFDLYNLPKSVKREVEVSGMRILIFFTWQSVSSLDNKIAELVASDTIENLLEQGAQVTVASHSMQNSVGTAKHLSLHELGLVATKFDMLITDNSSLSWDFLLCASHVLYYKPDPDWLLRNSKMELMKCQQIDQLANVVKTVLRAELDPADLFAFVDQSNCQRVYRLIEGA